MPTGLFSQILGPIAVVTHWDKAFDNYRPCSYSFELEISKAP